MKWDRKTIFVVLCKSMIYLNPKLLRTVWLIPAYKGNNGSSEW